MGTIDTRILTRLIGAEYLNRESLVLGDETHGELFRLKDSDSNVRQLVVVGDTGIDFFVGIEEMPSRDSKVIGQHLGIYGGGMEANFATAAIAASPELHLRFISRIGHGDLGEVTLQHISKLGIDTSSVVTDLSSGTWWCAVGLDATGEKALMGARTPAALPIHADFQPDSWGDISWLHILGDIEWSESAINTSISLGAVTSVDIEGSFATEFPQRARSLVLAADVSIINLSGLLALVGIEQKVGRLLDQLTEGAYRGGRSKALLITLGAKGALFVHRNPGEDWRFYGCEALRWPVVDSTGAGDSFAGTFVASLLKGLPISECMTRATGAAAKSMGRIGARGPRLDQYSKGEDNEQ